MKIIEISRNKMDEMAECMEDILRAGGRMMSCLEELRDGAEYGERRRTGMREPGRYDDMDDRMNRRRGDDGYMPEYGERSRYRR